MPEKVGDALSTQDRAAVLDLRFANAAKAESRCSGTRRAGRDDRRIRDKLGKDAPAKAEQRPQGARAAAGDEKPGAGLPVPTVESIVKSITKWWKNAPAIIVIDTMLDAPKEVLRQNTSARPRRP